MECDNRRSEAWAAINITSIVMMSLSAAYAMVFIPIFAKSLSGPKKLLTILQQICILFYLIVVILHHHQANSDSLFIMLFGGTTELQSSRLNLKFLWIWVMEESVIFLKFYTYALFNFFSYMLSIDTFQMVCKPLHYAEYSKPSRTVKRVTIGLVICLLLGIEGFARIPIRVFEPIMDPHTSYKMILGINILYICKLAIIKLIYSVRIVRIAQEVKLSLRESSRLRQNKQKKNAFGSLFLFTLIPLFLCVLFLGHDVFNTFYLFQALTGIHCKDDSVLVQSDVITCISVAIFTLASFSYGISYLILFPSLRRAVFCRKG